MDNLRIRREKISGSVHWFHLLGLHVIHIYDINHNDQVQACCLGTAKAVGHRTLCTALWADKWPVGGYRNGIFQGFDWSMCITEKFQRDYTVVWTKHTYIQTNQEQQYLMHPYIHAMSPRAQLPQGCIIWGVGGGGNETKALKLKGLLFHYLQNVRFTYTLHHWGETFSSPLQHIVRPKNNNNPTLFLVLFPIP